MTTARLSYELEEQLDTASRAKHMTKSDMVKEALAQYFAHDETEKSSYELGLPYFGKYGSGEGDLSVTYKNRMREKIGAKYHSR
ncbi:MAG: ribbon-helix-helix domain-containing protein [Spirochaetaceae bacterium]|jgi:hypothetical protein|nr:ribbon-helix-helix domain-containing protein [Spirochaetaceae bacterium]